MLQRVKVVAGDIDVSALGVLWLGVMFLVRNDNSCRSDCC